MIIHGDCLEVMQEMSGDSVDAVVTDPPFKLSQEYSTNTDPDNLIAVSGLILTAKEMLRLSKPGSILISFYDTRLLPFGLFAYQQAGWKYLRGLTFYRRWGNAHKLYGWMATSDFVLVFAKPGAKYQFYGDWKHDVYIRDKPEKEGCNHPAQKPIDALNHLISHITPENGTVLDPYGGSGSTAIACLNANRNYILIEKEKEYIDIINKRIAEHELQASP